MAGRTVNGCNPGADVWAGAGALKRVRAGVDLSAGRGKIPTSPGPTGAYSMV